MRLRGRAGAALAAALVLGLALAGCGETETPKPVTHAAPAQPRLLYKVGQPYQINGIWYYPKVDYDYDETGIASWYGPDFHGKDTALGEPYDMNELTAAHRTLPMPSMVRVTNLENGRVLALRVNDRGPYKKGRILDVSRRAAQLLDMQQNGTAHVRIEINATESLNLKNAIIARHPGDLPKVAAAPHPTIAASNLDAPTTTAPVSKAPPPRPVPKTNLPPIAEKPARVASATSQLPAGTGVYIQAGAFAESENAKRLEQQLKEFGNAFIVTVTVGARQLYRVRLGPLQDNEGADSVLSHIRSLGYEDAQIVRY